MCTNRIVSASSAVAVIAVIIWFAGFSVALNTTTAQACQQYRPNSASGMSVAATVVSWGDSNQDNAFSPLKTIACQRTWRHGAAFVTEALPASHRAQLVSILTGVGAVLMLAAIIGILIVAISTAVRTKRVSARSAHDPAGHPVVLMAVLPLTVLMLSTGFYATGMSGSAAISCFENDSSAQLSDWDSTDPLPASPARTQVVNALRKLDAQTYPGYGTSYGVWYLHQRVSPIGHKQCSYGPGPGSPNHETTWRGATSPANTAAIVIGLAGSTASLLFLCLSMLRLHSRIRQKSEANPTGQIARMLEQPIFRGLFRIRDRVRRHGSQAD